MQRRELIKMIAVLTGGSVIGADLFLAGCKSKEGSGLFSDEDIAFLDEIAETIIPKTNTPGAKDAETGKFIALYAADCYEEDQQQILKKGIKTLDEASEKKHKEGFMKINATQKKELLEGIDKEVKTYNQQPETTEKRPHYFMLMKQLTLLGFFTSKPGATQVLRYNPVPGKYEGCIDYKGETSWA